MEIFSTFIEILGVIALFYTLPYKDKDFVTDILNNFEIGDYASFIDHIDILEKLELIESAKLASALLI